MASWELTSAVSSLRSLLGDNAADKFEFKADCQPSPDGVTTRFFGGQRRMVADSLTVFRGGQRIAVSGTPDYDRGEFDLEVAPSGTVPVQASYAYQWFTDAELEQFLSAGSLMVGYEVVTDSGLPLPLRPAVLDFSCYYAYLRKAAEWAESVTASAGGYTVDQSKSHPNWRALAELALKAGQEKVKQYIDGGVADAKAPAVRFSTAYKVYPYIPNT